MGGGVGSASESVSDLSARRRSEALDGFVVPFERSGVVEASEAASSSLSSWYLRRLSSGRTPFSR